MALLLPSCLAPVTQTGEGGFASGASGAADGAGSSVSDGDAPSAAPSNDFPQDAGVTPQDAGAPVATRGLGADAVADNFQTVMMPSGTLAPSGTVGDARYLALQGTREPVCRMGDRTQVKSSGRLLVFVKGYEEPAAFDPGPCRLRVSYRTGEGVRDSGFKDVDFRKESASDFWAASAVVPTSDPASIRYFLFDPTTNAVRVEIVAQLEETPSDNPPPRCFEPAIQVEKAR